MNHADQLFTHPLTFVRAQRDWSLGDVADLVRRASGLNMAGNRQKVYRWEHGLAVPEPDAQLALASALGISAQSVHDLQWPHWLLLADGAEPIDQPWTTATTLQILTGSVNANVDRRSFLILAGEGAVGLAGVWAAVPAAKVAHAADGGSVDAEIVGLVDGRLRELWHLDDLVGGDHCLDLAQADLRLVVRLLERGRYCGDIERRLYGAAGELCRFAGWAAFDAERHASAERFWHAGLRTSAQAGDFETGAYILSLMAMQRTYAGDGRSAVKLLETARDKVSTRTSRTVHAMLDAWQVRAHAVAGEQQQARKMLTSADEHWEHRRPEDDPGFIYWMRRPSLTIEVGKALVVMGEPEVAARLLEEGMQERTSDYSRDIVLGLTTIADACLDQGDLDGAISTARRAIEVTANVDSMRVVDELRAFARRLPAQAAAAEEFRGDLANLTG